MYFQTHRMKKSALFFLLPVLLTLPACEHDFIEDDLSGKLVAVIAPADNDTVQVSAPLFWWNEINGARAYRVQIVYPDFFAPQQLLYDTAVVGDRFFPALSPGYTYTWRIRPENGSSEGEWVTRSLTIDSTVSLSNQTVVITFPAANGYATAGSSVAFSWNAVSAATHYRVEILNTVTAATVVSTSVTVNNYQHTLAQGSYEFRVRAENASSFTPWSTRTFSVDQTAPVTPVLVAPAHNSFYASPPSTLTFDWTSGADALTDSLFVSTDSTFAAVNVLQLGVSATQGGYNWTGALPATVYFWRVRSVDAAGNRSNYSAVYRFDVN
jgi:hypothetical protein